MAAPIGSCHSEGYFGIQPIWNYLRVIFPDVVLHSGISLHAEVKIPNVLLIFGNIGLDRKSVSSSIQNIVADRRIEQFLDQIRILRLAQDPHQFA